MKLDISPIRPLLANYFDLKNRVDELCQRIEQAYAPHISCKAGCDSCCRHLSLFPVEAFALAAAVRDLPPADGEALRIRARTAESDGTCPLLGNGLCLLYNSRPLICRTHGLPLLLTEENRQLVDYCPENFRDIPSLPGNAVIGLDQLNATLTAVNALVIAAPEVARLNLPQRITIAEALLMGDEPA